MSSDDSRVRITLRDMAWERAKGELYSMLCTFWGSEGENPKFFDEVKAAIDEFVEKIEQDLGI